MKDSVDFYFARAKASISLACDYLDVLTEHLSASDLDNTRKLGLIAAIKGKQNYLKALQLNPNAHPWVEVDNPV